MILKGVIDKFRLAEDLEIEIGKNLTAICGQNGTMKSTLLGCIAQPFGVGRGRKKDDKKEKYFDCMIVNQKFYTDINDIFKFSKEYDLPGNHVYHVYFDEDSNIMKQEEIVYENPLQVKSRKRPDGEKKHIRFVAGKSRSTGKGNIPLPVVYLGLSRLYPIGEVDDLKENNLELSDQEIVFFKKYYSEILLSFGSEEYKNEIKLIDKNKISTGGISTNSYDWQTISAGQDNIGKIILTILEFKRLKEKFKDNYFGGILLIDELEATLYPGAQKKLIEFLNKYSAKYNIKIIFTTHSLEIIKELLNNKVYNVDSKVNFLDKTRGSLINRTHIGYDEIKNNILVKIREENNNQKEIKIDVFFEDEEGEYLFKNIVSKKLKEYCKVYPLKIGITNIAAISNKISQLKNGIIVYDADYNKKSTNYKNNFKINVENHRNSLFFPGTKSIEKECLEILLGMEENDEFWDKCKCDNKQKFYAKRLQYTNLGKPEREQDKLWFLEERKNFGKNGNKLMEKFKEKYEKEIEEFNEELERKLINQLNRNYGIVKEKLK